MRATASRVVREGRFQWAAYALMPGGPWFFVVKTWTRRGAQRELRHFIAATNARWPE